MRTEFDANRAQWQTLLDLDELSRRENKKWSYQSARHCPTLDLPPGALWMAEYGDPKDPEMAQTLRGYSPYHNLRADCSYPPVLFTTSTFDDRVHPAHARKMTAKMEALGHRPYFYEQRTGGHQMNDGIQTPAEQQALDYSFLIAKLMTDSR